MRHLMAKKRNALDRKHKSVQSQVKISQYNFRKILLLLILSHINVPSYRIDISLKTKLHRSFTLK